MTKRFLLLAAGLLLLAGTAAAAPRIDRLDATLKKGRRLAVEVAATFTGPGEIRVAGNVNGVAVDLAKRVRKAGARRARFRIDAKRLHLKNLAEPLVFDLGVTASETAGGAAVRDLAVEVPVPLVLLPGLGNEELPGTVETFAGALNLAAGNRWEAEGKHANLVVFGYPSLSRSLPDLGRDLSRVVRKLTRRSPFGRVDVVGYSMGGLVARSFMASRRGEGKVRRLVFAGTPNEGTPLAYLAVQGAELGVLDELLPAGTEGLVDLLLDPGSREALRTFFPTYDWAYATLPVVGRVPVPADLLPDSASPLTALNALGPEPGVSYHAVAYSDLGGETLGLPVGTVETVDFTGLLTGEGVDLADLASGEGDGLVPLRSVFMTDEPAWAPVVARHDMGTGNHLGLLADPAVILKVVEILSE